VKIHKASAAVMLLMVSCVILAGCASKAESAAETQTAKVQRGNININIAAGGNLQTSNEANLTFYSSGTVQEVMVKIGDTVEEGAALAMLDTAPLESSLAQAQISVKSAQLNLERAREPQSNSSGTQLLTAPDPLDIEIKELQLKNAKDNLSEAEKKLRNATITAPFAGLVTEVNVVPGDQVSETTVAVRIIDPASFESEVLVNEMEIYQLNIGTPATVKVAAVPTITFPAKVVLISETPTIQSNVVNYKVTVKMDPLETAAGNQEPIAAGTAVVNTAQLPGPSGEEAQAASGQTAAAIGQRQQQWRQQMQAPAALPRGIRLKEGLTVTINIGVENRTSVLLVPNKAITSRGGKYYAQVVSSSGVTEERAIQLGVSDGQNTEVISGLSEGDQVAIAGSTATQPSTSTTQQQRQQGGQILIPGAGGVRIPR